MIRFGFFFCSIPMCDNIRRIEGVFAMPLLREISSFGPFYGWHVFHIRTLFQHKHAQNPTSSSIKELWMYVLIVSSICTVRFSCYYYHTYILLDKRHHAWKKDFHLCLFLQEKFGRCHSIFMSFFSTPKYSSVNLIWNEELWIAQRSNDCKFKR